MGTWMTPTELKLWGFTGAWLCWEVGWGSGGGGRMLLSWFPPLA